MGSNGLTLRKSASYECRFRHIAQLGTIIILALLAGVPLDAQNVGISPDCFFFFRLTGTGRYPSAGYSNATAGCVAWTMVYYSTGFSAVSLRLDSAPDSSGAAGTWGAFAVMAGTISVGSNPSTATTQASYTAVGFNPWVSVNLTTATGSGTVNGFAYGYRVNSIFATTISSAGSTQDVNLTQVAGAAVALGQAAMAASVPVVIANNQSTLPANVTQFGGTNLPSTALAGAAPIQSACPNSASISLTGSGYTQIVAASGSTVIYVCKVAFGSSAVANFKIARGVCAGTPTDITGTFQNLTGMDLDFLGNLKTGAGDALCLSQSAANTTGGVVTYAQF